MKREVEDTHIYFPVKVLNGIRKLARENRRSVSAEMIIAAERYIAASKPENGRLSHGKEEQIK
jgi:hypothetical protein